jgi:hypothetical protein
MLRNVLLAGLISFVACSGPPIINTVIQHDVPIAVPDAQPLTMNSIQWRVMDIVQLKALVAQLQVSQQKHFVFVLDEQNYTNLSLNFVEIKRYIQEQKVILTMLKQIIAQRAGQTTDAKPTLETAH